MANRFWTDTTDLKDGTKARAMPLNEKHDGVELGFDRVQSEMDLKPTLPASFTGNHQIPEKSYLNQVIYINGDGDADLYPIAQIEADRIAAELAATQAQSRAAEAALSADEAEAAEIAAGNSASAAASSASQANTSASLAAGYANEVEDTAVTPGLYSAYHWSEKARAYMEDFTPEPGPEGPEGPQGPIGPEGPEGPAGTTAWSGLTGKPTTLGGFGITDAYTEAASDARFLRKDAENDYIDLVNHEMADYAVDGRLYYDLSAGLYLQASNAGHANPALLWSSANVVAGTGIGITYGTEDEPTISLGSHTHSEYALDSVVVKTDGSSQTITGRKTFNVGIGVLREDNVYVTPTSFTYAAHWKFAQESQLDSPPGSGLWSHLLTIQGSSAHNSGFPSYQMCFRNGAIGIRQSVNNTTWDSWETLATVEKTYSRGGAGGNITISSSAASGGSNGDLWFKV